MTARPCISGFCMLQLIGNGARLRWDLMLSISVRTPFLCDLVQVLEFPTKNVHQLLLYKSEVKHQGCKWWLQYAFDSQIKRVVDMCVTLT